MNRFFDRHRRLDMFVCVSMPAALFTVCLFAMLMLVSACADPSNEDTGNARSHRLAELTDQYECHIGGILKTDKGAIIEPRGVNSADKLGHVSVATATATVNTNVFDVIVWCAK